MCVDDASRLTFVEMKPDEKAVSAVAFLRAAVADYANLGVTVDRVMTDNGSCHKAFDFRDACRDLGLRRIRTKPYTPKANRKSLPLGLTRGPSAHPDGAARMGLRQALRH